MVTANTPQPSGLFGAYQQVGDLDRTLSFYRDVLALEVVWSDGALAVLHGHRANADSLVIREIGRTARHTKGEAGVTRVLWRAGDPAELDSAEALLTRQPLPYRQRRDTEVDASRCTIPTGSKSCSSGSARKSPPPLSSVCSSCHLPDKPASPTATGRLAEATLNPAVRIVDAYTRRSPQPETTLDHHRPDPCPTRT